MTAPDADDAGLVERLRNEATFALQDGATTLATVTGTDLRALLERLSAQRREIEELRRGREQLRSASIEAAQHLHKNFDGVRAYLAQAKHVTACMEVMRVLTEGGFKVIHKDAASAFAAKHGAPK
jgi:hypothetical protein